jgi:hypothetical protein
MGVAEAHEAGALGVLGDAAFDGNAAKLVRGSFGRSHVR